MGDGQGEAHSDRGVNRVPAGFEDVDADIGGVRFDGHDHRAASVYWTGCATGGRYGEEAFTD